MPDSTFRQLVENTVDQALGQSMTSLRTRLVEQICGKLAGTSASPASDGASSSLLNAAFSAIQKGATQADILVALLQSSEAFSGRAVLFVLRAGSAIAWRARGFASDPRGATLNTDCVLAASVLEHRAPASGSTSDFDPVFLAAVGAPQGSLLVVPLLVREKIAAMLYADGGQDSQPRLDAGALESLVRFAGMWIELVAARKSGGMATDPEPRKSFEASSVATYVPSQAEPEAGLQVEQQPAGSRAFAAASGSVADPFAVATPSGAPPAPQAQAVDEEEIHRKARRFARLLVDEIRLYNQQKVEEGRQNADLYARLKVEIDKSRSAYDKRYGDSVAGPSGYFQQELVRILANNNPGLLGSDDSG